VDQDQVLDMMDLEIRFDHRKDGGVWFSCYLMSSCVVCEGGKYLFQLTTLFS
jgi:hypothetical protein